MKGIPRPMNISTKQRRIAKLARDAPEMAFTSLAHHMDLAWLEEAHRLTRKDGATGIDGRSAQEYGQHLRRNLLDLLDRAKSGRYRAPAVRRVHIPKDRPGETRPLGIPTYEDKVLQRAVAMLLESVYEQDFLDCSYGFRPRRSVHDATRAIFRGSMALRGGWILEVDIRRFFDSIDHGKLREVLSKRVRDGVIVRLIGKWLNAGVMENGRITHPRTGTPQGGVISPLLANIFLHEVLDTWFEADVQPRLRGSAFLVRYADDYIIGFEREDDARKVMDVLPKRFGKYGLTLHPDKTQLVPFQRPPYGGKRDRERTGSFDFLGFTHYWGLSRKGKWVVKQKTAKDRLARSLRRLDQWMRRWRHLSLDEQQESLRRKMLGHYSGYGIIGNFQALHQFYRATVRRWKYWLDRRSQRGEMLWERFVRLLTRYPLPLPRVVHRLGAT